MVDVRSTAVSQLRRGALEYTRRGVIAAHDVVQACNTALMLLYANLLDLRNIFDIFKLIIDSEGRIFVPRIGAIKFREQRAG